MTTTSLGRWLRRELQRRELTQHAAAVYAGVASATLSEILNKGYVPKVETLFRLADYFETPRLEVLRLAGHLPPASLPEGAGSSLGGADAVLVRELLDEFRRVPDEWKPVVVEQMVQFRRLAELRPVHMIGEGKGVETGERPTGRQGGEDAEE